MQLTQRSKSVDRSPMTFLESLYLWNIMKGMAITLRHLFKKVDQRDIFGMVVQRDESYFIKRLDPEIALALRHKISQYVDMYMKKLAKE